MPRINTVFVITFLILGIVSYNCPAQSVPEIISFKRSEYNGQHQNWAIAEDCDGNMIIANSDGVLIFNGFSWRKVLLPNRRKCRTVFVDDQCRIHVGGFETMGQIDLSQENQPVYVPIGDSILLDTNQEIWHIFGGKQQVIFQSFSEVNILKDGQLSSLLPPSNIMFGQQIHERPIIPSIYNTIYLIEGNDINPIPSSINTDFTGKITAICEGDKPGSMIVGTQFSGLYLFNGEIIQRIDAAIQNTLEYAQINRLIRTNSGELYIGTILDGIYVLDSQYKIKFHINKTNGLTNNTVLALHEDSSGNVWSGQDQGLNLIRANNPTQFYYDVGGLLGNFFCYNYLDGKRIIGTNQGIFRESLDGYYKLIPETQGQTWVLTKHHSSILAGHNSGILKFSDSSVSNVYNQTGVYWIESLSEKLLLVSTYTGLRLFNTQNLSEQYPVTTISESIILERLVTKDNLIVGYHPQNEIIIGKINVHEKKFEQLARYEQIKGIPIDTKIFLFKHDGQIYLANNFKIARLNEQWDFEPVSDIERVSINLNPLYQAYRESMKLGDQVPRFSNLESPSNNLIVGFDEGFAILPMIPQTDRDSNFFALDYFTVNGKIYEVSANQEISLSHDQNDLGFYFERTNLSMTNDVIFWRLENWDQDYYPLTENGILEFLNLEPATYTLHLRSEEKRQDYSVMEFSITPPWYMSWIGLVLFSSVLTGLFIWLNRYHSKKLKRETKKLNEENAKELEQTRIKARNENLEKELLHKSKLLANSALTLAQKNKMLNKLKTKVIQDITHESNINHQKQKLLHLIDKNLKGDDEWQIFEKNFAEVHNEFLENLKIEHPHLTTGDLRLAAYVKMDLSSKEIAPLLDISVRSVENKRYRLRKKLGLEGSDNLSNALMRY